MECVGSRIDVLPQADFSLFIWLLLPSQSPKINCEGRNLANRLFEDPTQPIGC